MTSPSDVLIAGPDYLPGVMKLCEQLSEENAFLPVNWDKVKELVWCALSKSVTPRITTPGLIGAIGTPDATEGMSLLRLSQLPYSDEWMLEEVWVFVDAAHRASQHAKSLIAFNKKTAKDMGLKLFTGILSNVRTEAKVRLYERSLQKAGAFFIYDPANDPPTVAAA